MLAHGQSVLTNLQPPQLKHKQQQQQQLVLLQQLLLSHHGQSPH